MLKYIKPPLVLMIITAVTVGLLIFVHEITYVDKSGDISYLTADCERLLGEDSFTLSDFTYEGVYKTVIGEKKNGIAFEVVTKGYNAGGIDVLVVIDKNGAVLEVVPVAINETPGLGTNVEGKDFLSQYIGKAQTLTTGKVASDTEIAALTGATKSSKGVTDAVNIALNAYKSAKEAGVIE